MKSHLYSLLKLIIGWPLTLLAVFFIGKILVDQSPQILPHLHTLNPLILALGILCFIIFYFLRSYLWYRIVQQYTGKMTFKESSYLWSISELKRYIPGSIWSFLGRTVLFSQKGIDKKDIGAGLIVEAELFIIGCIIASLLSLPLYFSNNTLLHYLFFILVGIGVIVFIFNRKVIHAFPKKMQRITHFILPAYPSLEIFILISISVLAVLFFGLGNYFVLSAAVNTDPQLIWQLLGMFILAFVAGYLSVITPAGFGVREGITIYSLIKIIPYGLATFVALFSRIILIISELFFILLSYLWYKLHSPFVIRVEKWIAHHPYEVIIGWLSSIYALYFTTISFLRYDNFYTGRFDLGNMAQTVWNTLHGRIFLFTNPNGTEPISRLAFHADFILVLLAPFYFLWQDPRMLLLIQSVVLAVGAFFVYYIARDVLKNKPLALTFAIAYLLNPSLQRANLYDFHPVTLVTTMLLATYYFYQKRKYKLFLLFAFLSGLCKEEIWLIIALFGVLLFFHHKKKLFGVIVASVSAAICYFLFTYAIPNALGSQHFALAYLSDYGDSPSKIIRGLILSPDKLFMTLLEPDRIEYLKQLLMPLGYTSLAFPFFLILASPDLAINLLSNNAQLHQIYYQYTAPITPFIFLCAIYGIWVIKKYVPKIPMYCYILYIAGFSLWGAYSIGPLPGAHEPNIAMITKPVENREFIDYFLTRIPKRYSVAASNNVGSHLSQRQNIYTLPLGIDKADIIVYLLNDSESAQSINAEQQLLTKMKQDRKYFQMVHKDDFYVFIRLHEDMSY